MNSALPRILFCLVAILVLASACEFPTPPLQPDSGPGGTEYLHGSFTPRGPYWAEGPYMPNNYLYYIIEPADPTPIEAPVVLFLHAYMAYDPTAYREWMIHIVRKGYTVVWVRYDEGYTDPGTWPNKATATWQHALNRLDTYIWEGHVRPEKDEYGEYKTAYVGHSMGGYLSTILATRAAYPENSLPIPWAIACFAPGRLGHAPDEHWWDMDPRTSILLVVGDNDGTVCTETALAVWNATGHIPDENRDFLHVFSDIHGMPWLAADHIYPKTAKWRGVVDAHDYFITYKLSVAALNCVFRDEDCDYAFGNGHPNQVSLGEWSDGQPVVPLAWYEDPNTIETTCTNWQR